MALHGLSLSEILLLGGISAVAVAYYIKTSYLRRMVTAAYSLNEEEKKYVASAVIGRAIDESVADADMVEKLIRAGFLCRFPDGVLTSSESANEMVDQASEVFQKYHSPSIAVKN